jgi:hypothetical protein
MAALAAAPSKALRALASPGTAVILQRFFKIDLE